MRESEREKNYYFSNRDLLIIAVLSGIGGVMSTYVGYIGNLINRVLGVPFGAGQFASGLHVFWFILVAGLIRKPGATTAAGLLKGLIELFTGSSHGLVIVLVSLIQGGAVDLVLLLTRHYKLYSYMVAGGIAAASNVFVFQTLYFSGVRLTYLLFIGGLAFISGLLLAGAFGHNVLEVVFRARPVRIGAELGQPGSGPGKIPITMKLIATALSVLLFSGGAIYYFAAIYEPPWAGPRCRVEGAVERPFEFTLARFSNQETTITAELKGQFKYEPPQQYTGIPLAAIVKEAVPLNIATTVLVIATDGYTVEFDLDHVLADDQMLLVQEENLLRLIAGCYDGGHWVRMVTKIVLE